MKIGIRQNFETDLVDKLADDCSLDKNFARLLLQRNIDTPDKVNQYLYGTIDNITNPYSYLNMDKAVNRIRKSIDNNERILIYGDYDCDGIGALAILYLSFFSIGKIVDYYIPTRSEEGYGLNCDTVQKIKNDFAPDLIITVDCGIASINEIKLIKELGMDVIVTDHHRFGTELPDCLVIDPCLNPELTQLCGAGVALQLASAVFGKNIAYKYLDICAISTVADLVPLTGDNRLIVKSGIANISSGKCRKGIKQLMQSANTVYNQINAYDIAFKLAPRLNASGRLSNAYNSLHLLIEEDTTAISLLAEELEMQNAQRQALNQAIYEQAMEILKHYDFGKYKIIVLHKEDWNEGVIGIVSAKLVEKFNLPTILLTGNGDGVKGSARSIATIDIYDAISHCKDSLKKYGGHPMAAGVSLAEEKIKEFTNNINDYILQKYSVSSFDKEIIIDEYLAIKDIKPNILTSLDLLEPYGLGNSKPLFCDEVNNFCYKQIGTSKHIKARTKNGDIIAFGYLENLEILNSKHLPIIYTVEKNYYNDSVSNQFRIKSAIFDNHLPTQSEILERYLYALVNKEYDYDRCIKKIAVSNSPTLYIAYSLSAYNEFIKTNNGINTVIFRNQYLNCVDTVALSPSADYEFEYYNRIVVLDAISEPHKKYFERINPNSQFSDYFEQPERFINIETLREIYLEFKRILNKEYKQMRLTELFSIFSENGFRFAYYEFLVAYYIFIDVGLIKMSDNAILTMTNNRTDMKKSLIFRRYIIE